MEQDDDMIGLNAGALMRSDVGSIPPQGRLGGDQVTTGLQRLFASIADEPIPEDFLRLLDDIETRAANDVGPGRA